MRIDRINRIKKHRVFHDFSWPQNLHDFSQFNVIYGWNGAGKTTLSNLFRALERREDILEGEIEFLIDGRSHNGKTFSSSKGLPKIRVFNRNYIDQNFFVTKQTITPIYYLGEDSVEKQKKVEQLKPSLEKLREDIAKKEEYKRTAESNLESFCIQQAKSIKELLSSSPSNAYNNYNKSHFRQLAESFLKTELSDALLSDEEKSIFRQQKENRPKPTIGIVSVTRPDFLELGRMVEAVLARTVVSNVISELANNAQIAEWAQLGLKLHTGKHASPSCHFCSQTITDRRIRELEAHFNDEYAKFLDEIDSLEQDITAHNEAVQSTTYFPVQEQFYEHLAKQLPEAMRLISDQIEIQVVYLSALLKALRKKRSHPFVALRLDEFLGDVLAPVEKDIVEGFKTLDELISSHNSETGDFQRIVETARQKLEHCLMAEALSDFKAKTEVIASTAIELKLLNDEANNVVKEIAALQKDILSHLKPADELNLELCNYLGRNELVFATRDTGYEILRNGFPALHLSEGERTAIAFLYFLKTLQDAEFSLNRDIVVIDDPVSSLDTNALFCAFGYMKERTKESGQMIVLTHNFGFFRQIKNWFNHLPGQRKTDASKRPARFFMLQTQIIEGVRNGTLRPLDPLLHQYDSEYHYLFKKVYDAKNESLCGSLEDYYALPNIARRLMEAFLSFRFPAQAGELKLQLDKVDFDSAKKARILRFLHTYSHDGRVAEPEHDLSVLSETPQILAQILELLESEDSKHYSEMVALTTLPGH